MVVFLVIHAIILYMSYKAILNAANELNREIATLRSQGKMLPLVIDGRPRLKIESFDPLVYTNYGMFSDRAPHVSGKLALRAIMASETNDDNALVYLAVETEVAVYGFSLGEAEVLNGIASALGKPELAVFTDV